MLWQSLLSIQHAPLQQQLVQCDLVARLVHLFLGADSPVEATPKPCPCPDPNTNPNLVQEGLMPPQPTPVGLVDYKMLFNSISLLVKYGTELPPLSVTLLRSAAFKKKLCDEEPERLFVKVPAANPHRTLT